MALLLSHNIMMRGSVQQEYITIVTIYAPNKGSSKYINQILADTKGYIDNNIIRIKNFSISLILMDRSSRKKIYIQNPWDAFK